jgi:hypothetical protein
LACAIASPAGDSPLTLARGILRSTATKEISMLWLIVIVVLLAVFAAPAWPYSRGWGYYPSGGLGLIVLILILLLVLGAI